MHAYSYLNITQRIFSSLRFIEEQVLHFPSCRYYPLKAVGFIIQVLYTHRQIKKFNLFNELCLSFAFFEPYMFIYIYTTYASMAPFFRRKYFGPKNSRIQITVKIFHLRTFMISFLLLLNVFQTLQLAYHILHV